VASSQGTILSADWLGKQKTIWQIVFASYLLVMNAAAREPAMAWVRPLFEAPGIGRRIMVPVLLTITLVVTVWSGAAYLWKNRRLVLNEM
jgi:phosphatidylglycerophosphate synthase